MWIYVWLGHHKKKEVTFRRLFFLYQRSSVLNAIPPKSTTIYIFCTAYQCCNHNVNRELFFLRWNIFGLIFVKNKCIDELVHNKIDCNLNSPLLCSVLNQRTKNYFFIYNFYDIMWLISHRFIEYFCADKFWNILEKVLNLNLRQWFVVD